MEIQNIIDYVLETPENTNPTILRGMLEQIEGIKPTGKKTITDTAEADVTNYASAQVVDPNLKAANIKKDIPILGITGSYVGQTSNFSTATLTINCVDGTDDLIIPNVIAEGFPGLSAISSLSYGENIITVALCYGHAYGYLSNGSISDVQGDIEIESSNYLDIYGDASFTLTF